MAPRPCTYSRLGLPLGLEAPVMTPKGETFLFFHTAVATSLYLSTLINELNKGEHSQPPAHHDSNLRLSG